MGTIMIFNIPKVQDIIRKNNLISEEAYKTLRLLPGDAGDSNYHECRELEIVVLNRMVECKEHIRSLYKYKASRNYIINNDKRILNILHNARLLGYFMSVFKFNYKNTDYDYCNNYNNIQVFDELINDMPSILINRITKWGNLKDATLTLDGWGTLINKCTSYITKLDIAEASKNIQYKIDVINEIFENNIIPLNDMIKHITLPISFIDKYINDISWDIVSKIYPFIILDNYHSHVNWNIVSRRIMPNWFVIKNAMYIDTTKKIYIGHLSSQCISLLLDRYELDSEEIDIFTKKGPPINIIKQYSHYINCELLNLLNYDEYEIQGIFSIYPSLIKDEYIINTRDEYIIDIYIGFNNITRSNTESFKKILSILLLRNSFSNKFLYKWCDIFDSKILCITQRLPVDLIEKYLKLNIDCNTFKCSNINDINTAALNTIVLDVYY